MSDTPRTDAARLDEYDPVMAIASECAKLERELTAAQADSDKWRDEYNRMRRLIAKQDQDISQTCGKALGYPWFKDDQKNFPGSTEEHGVCVGEHVAETIAAELADAYKAAQAEIALLKAGGCARNQRTTQFCAEALKLQERIRRLEKSGDRLRKYLRIAVGPDAKGWETPHGVDIGKRIEAAIASWTKAKDAQ